MSLFQKDVLLLHSEEVLRQIFGVSASHEQLRQKLCSQILEVSFSKQAVAHRCVVFALPKSATTNSSAISSTQAQFEELAFFGDSQQCLDLALDCAKQAEKIIVIGTRSRDNVMRMTQHYLQRLCGPQTSTLKRLDV